MKCCKVICFWFGWRRQFSNNVSNITELVPAIVNTELNIENGIDTDVLFVVNKSNTELDNSLDQYDGMKTKNGTIKVIKRDNIGLSFGAYLTAFSQFKNEYDYWFFSEDDVIIYHENYMKSFVDFWEKNKEQLGFIALAPISNYGKLHCGGGCGLVSTDWMKKTYNDSDIIRILQNYSTYEEQYDIADSTLGSENAEVLFSSSFVHGGKTIMNHSEYSPLAANYTKHNSQRSFETIENLNKKFIYTVGA